MKGKSIMVQGTSSSVGKSIVCTALCRIFTQDGYNVNPFKSQNMSLNSYITYEGHEMGRAQVMQAEASNKAPSSMMNPILLKPTTDRKSQVIIKGKVFKNMDAVDYFKFKPELKGMVKEIFQELRSKSDIVVIEGAGSPAEINLKQEDIVNMGMAKMAEAPVILVGDIDRGGVFASIAGTMLLLDDEEKKRVKGVIINKFRGSIEILEPGLRQLEKIIGVPVLGVIPHFQLNIEDEDSVSDWLDCNSKSNGDIDIAVIRLPHLSNFTDFNALKLFEDVSVRYVKSEDELGNPDIIIIPGTKNTIEDMLVLKNTGLADKVIGCYEKGSFVFGICGGYQMLGREMTDSMGVESSAYRTEGLGLINASTDFKEVKTTTLSKGHCKYFDCEVSGYEIHMGKTEIGEGAIPLINVETQNGITERMLDGIISEDGRVFGTYMHGIFDNSVFTQKFLNRVRENKGLKPLENDLLDYSKYKEQQYDELAKIVRDNLDMDKLYHILEAGI